MKKIKNWSNFSESLQTPLSEDEKEKIGRALIKSCKNVWGYIDGFWVKNHGVKILGEILRLSKNNRILINHVNSISPSTTVDDLVNWISTNEVDLYHPTGKYFKNIIAYKLFTIL